MRGEALQPARDLAVHRVEQFAAAGIDRGDDLPLREPHGEREQVEAGDADHGDAQRLRERLGRCDADAQSGEQTRSEIDGDATDLAEVDSRLPADEVDGRRQVLRVTLAARRMRLREHTLVPAHGSTDLHRARLDAEDQQPAAPIEGDTHSDSTRPSALVRADQLGPTARTRMVRSSSSVPKLSRTSRKSAGSDGRIASPHSMSVTPPSSSTSGKPMSYTSFI